MDARARTLTHVQCSQTGRASDIPGVVEGRSGKQWTKPGLKLESCCHTKNDLTSKLRETLMDTLEHSTVAGHPNISVPRDNNLTAPSGMILQQTWRWGILHDVSSCLRGRSVFGASESANHMTHDLSEWFALPGSYQNAYLHRTVENSCLIAVFTQTI